VDASVLVCALADDTDDGVRVRTRLRSEDLAGPEIIDLEVLSVLRRLNLSQAMTSERAAQALADLAALRINRIPHRALIGRCWDLRHNMTVYDAAYVAASEILDACLLTGDAKLANAPGSRCDIELIA